MQQRNPSPLLPSTKADMTLPRALRERLIFVASLSLSPGNPRQQQHTHSWLSATLMIATWLKVGQQFAPAAAPRL
jgi:hypothetical protein